MVTLPDELPWVAETLVWADVWLAEAVGVLVTRLELVMVAKLVVELVTIAEVMMATVVLTTGVWEVVETTELNSLEAAAVEETSEEEAEEDDSTSVSVLTAEVLVDKTASLPWPTLEVTVVKKVLVVVDLAASATLSKTADTNN